MLQPMLISTLLSYYDENIADQHKETTYLYAGLIILTSVISVICVQLFNFSIMQIGMKMRVACCSLIYRKSLRLSKSALAETTIGQMVNLLSNDVSRFDQATHFLHQIVFAPIEILVVMYLCYNSVGWTGLIGTIFLIVALPFQCKYCLFYI